MKTRTFLLHYFSAYGCQWFIVVLLALVTQSHIDTGQFGMYGFPIIALAYALFITKISAAPNIKIRELEKDNKRLKTIIDHLDISHKGNSENTEQA